MGADDAKITRFSTFCPLAKVDYTAWKTQSLN